MGLSAAEKQRAYRERQSQRWADLVRENGELRLALADALAENDRLSDRDAAALAVPSEACRHPAESVAEGLCHRCGADLW